MSIKKVQLLTGLLSEEKILQLITERLSQFVVIGDTEPTNGPVFWFDTGVTIEGTTVMLTLNENVDIADVLASIDGTDYAIVNANAPVEGDDGVYVIEIT